MPPRSCERAQAEQLAALQEQVAKEKADAAVRAAMSAGKLAPAMQEWALSYAIKDPDGFAQWVAAAPSVLTDVAAATHRAAPDHELTDEDRYVCAALGLPEKDFAAHKQELARGRAR
ncbi:MAG: phage protease [Rhodocyclaceae bacterium]|nr:phage protease [Rhodocyclaceae bacterium]